MNKGILFLTGLVLTAMLMSGMVLADPVKGATPSTSVTASATIPGYISLTVDNAPRWASIVPGTVNQASDDPQMSITIGQETNSNVNVSVIAGGDFATNFAITNMKFAQYLKGISQGDVVYSKTVSQVICSFDQPISAPGSCISQHRLSVPNGLAQGTYSAQVTLTAIPTA
jgi:hypothetical protein